MAALVHENNDNDSDSFSSGSDDEFLTVGKAGDNVDREALIRKKLLENFYGATPTAGGVNDKGGESSDDGLSSDDDDDDDDLPADPRSSQDLDSPHFNADQHKAHHVLTENVHNLLEVEESLACQVRTLDSSMQTLVYENYSRFIEATDAIKSISVHVQAHSSGLKELQDKMNDVSKDSLQIEQTVGSLRDQVVEKIRVKRLLQRLDALLKLPSTLHSHMSLHKYRWATKSYVSALAILHKHSEGFDSLKKIETECHGIMKTLMDTVQHKLIHWSGASLLEDEEEDDDDDYEDSDEKEASRKERLEIMDEDNIPDPPTSILDIFECAGTPILIWQSKNAEQLTPRLSAEKCKEYALKACLRWLERVLDSHQIELVERMFASKAKQEGGAAVGEDEENLDWLIPTNILDSILEAATLYSMTFLQDQEGHPQPDEALSVFVSSAFSTFLTHVRGALLEQALQASPNTLDDDDLGLAAVAEETSYSMDDRAHLDGKDEEAYDQISSALTLLLQGVKQLSSGLVLQEVAVDNDLASSLVDQTVSLTETMVRKRVDQKFISLRHRVIEDCLAPMARATFSQFQDGKQSEQQQQQDQSLLEVVQLASVALSDSLQLVDDTVRSILATSETEETMGVDGTDRTDDPLSPSSYNDENGPSADGAMMLEAVEQSSKRFALWLAATMEVMSGCEPSHSSKQKLLDAADSFKAPKLRKMDTDSASYDTGSMDESTQGDDLVDTPEPWMEDSSDPVVERALWDLMEEISKYPKNGNKSSAYMTLAISEMCRVAERSVMENIAQSISAHSGQRGKGRKNKSFQMSNTFDSTTSTRGLPANPIAARFRLAASRTLNLYAMDRGAVAADLLCDESMKEKCSKEEGEVSESPRPGAWQVLEIVKETCFDCADLFGGSTRAGPVPENLEDEFISLTMSHAKSGLAIDVERMFAEKIVVYPHPNDMADFSRNAVVVLILKVALKAFAEHSRCVKFSLSGYRQLMVDMEFIKFLIPHYVKDEFLGDGSNSISGLEALLTEASSVARKRCFAIGELGDHQEEVNVARGAVRVFMSVNSDRLVKKFTIEDDGDKK
eukprot:CAMPEP_0113631014 /NCGR_PEP_ID=MMETSP0017_2-20120614/16117_1 /TAXON_ID=2856 /ORGANISM="Cylindrotheca closterium" /LENGTH=1073 /DNA_ID=CAMNT_0000541507 /DNA_START=14 /DNA_END=3235 /DNA_ORIENTATION=+ /assembly_acc=CAM_ASM_000147